IDRGVRIGDLDYRFAIVDSYRRVGAMFCDAGLYDRRSVICAALGLSACLHRHGNWLLVDHQTRFDAAARYLIGGAFWRTMRRLIIRGKLKACLCQYQHALLTFIDTNVDI